MVVANRAEALRSELEVVREELDDSRTSAGDVGERIAEARLLQRDMRTTHRSRKPCLCERLAGRSEACSALEWEV